MRYINLTAITASSISNYAGIMVTDGNSRFINTYWRLLYVVHTFDTYWDHTYQSSQLRNKCNKKQLKCDVFLWEKSWGTTQHVWSMYTLFLKKVLKNIFECSFPTLFSVFLVLICWEHIIYIFLPSLYCREIREWCICDS